MAAEFKQKRLMLTGCKVFKVALANLAFIEGWTLQLVN